MFYKYFLIIICSYSAILQVLRIFCLVLKPSFLMKFRLISGTNMDRIDLLLYYMAMLVVLLQVIFNQLNITA